jgi:hypothetical protein
VSGVSAPIFCSILSYFLFSLFLPLPIRDEVMQRGEQLFIPPPSPSSNIRVCDEVGKNQEGKLHIYTSSSFGSQNSYAYPSSFITNYTFFFLLSSSKHVYCSGLFYIILIAKNPSYFSISIFYLFPLLYSYFWVWGWRGWACNARELHVHMESARSSLGKAAAGAIFYSGRKTTLDDGSMWVFFFGNGNLGWTTARGDGKLSGDRSARIYGTIFKGNNIFFSRKKRTAFYDEQRILLLFWQSEA